VNFLKFLAQNFWEFSKVNLKISKVNLFHCLGSVQTGLPSLLHCTVHDTGWNIWTNARK